VSYLTDQIETLQLTIEEHRLRLDPRHDAEHLWRRYVHACDGDEKRAAPLFIQLGEAIIARGRQALGAPTEGLAAPDILDLSPNDDGDA
jgi:hypothetical protein